MITSINEFKKINESILVPRNIDGRKEKLKQKNYQLLQQEVIEGSLLIDENFEFNNPIVKCKRIIGDVRINNLGYIPEWLENIEIDGNFNCESNGLTTLKGCPKYVGSFECGNNKLTSLEFGPIYVDKFYNCHSNLLTTLKGCPEIINGGFTCSNNKLTSLEHGPKDVLGYYNCRRNQLPNLKGIPMIINLYLDIVFNPLESLEYFPSTIYGNLYATGIGLDITEEDIRKFCNVNGDIDMRL